MQRKPVIGLALVLASALLVGTCAAFPSPTAGFFGSLQAGLAGALVISVLVSIVAGISASLTSRPAFKKGTMSLRVLGWLGTIIMWAALTPPMFYLFAPAAGLWGVFLAPPAAILTTGAWSLVRRGLTRPHTADDATTSPWSLGRGAILTCGAALVLVELAPSWLSEGRYGERALSALGERFGLTDPALGILVWIRTLSLAAVGVLGFVWGVPPKSLPGAVRVWLVLARLVAAVLLTLPLAVAASEDIQAETMAEVLPDALALVGAWALLYESWDARRRIENPIREP